MGNSNLHGSTGPLPAPKVAKISDVQYLLVAFSVMKTLLKNGPMPNGKHIALGRPKGSILWSVRAIVADISDAFSGKAQTSYFATSIERNACFYFPGLLYWNQKSNKNNVFPRRPPGPHPGPHFSAVDVDESVVSPILRDPLGPKLLPESPPWRQKAAK